MLSRSAEDPLKSHRREIVAVFLDLRGFTAFTETSDPEDVMGVIREYHAAMGELVMAHGGTVERFAGDGIMIVFNDPVPMTRPRRKAVRMAIAMQERFARWPTDGTRGYALGMGIGVAQGYATIGAIGCEGRREYSAIGTVCNLAARLCGRPRAGRSCSRSECRLWSPISRGRIRSASSRSRDSIARSWLTRCTVPSRRPTRRRPADTARVRLRRVSSWFFPIVLFALVANAVLLVLIKQSYDTVVAAQQHRQSALGLADELHRETEQLARSSVRTRRPGSRGTCSTTTTFWACVRARSPRRRTSTRDPTGTT